MSTPGEFVYKRVRRSQGLGEGGGRNDIYGHDKTAKKPLENKKKTTDDNNDNLLGSSYERSRIKVYEKPLRVHYA